MATFQLKNCYYFICYVEEETEGVETRGIITGGRQLNDVE